MNLKKMEPSTNYDVQFTITTTSRDPVSTSDVNGAIYGTVYDSCRVLNTQTGRYVGTWRNPVSLVDLCSTTTHHFDLQFS
jgi:hypothetical protein